MLISLQGRLALASSYYRYVPDFMLFSIFYQGYHPCFYLHLALFQVATE